jgi:hypothetical protein
MGTKRPFESDRVLVEYIRQAGLCGYHVGFDRKAFRLEPLVDVIRSVIPEYALGYHQGQTVAIPQTIEKLKEAANTVYKTPNFKRRGEFGELILHLLLRDFHGTIPLVSTIYFRDAVNVPAHGFDGVHVIDTPTSKKLVLGESKLYKSGDDGIANLLLDIKKHLNNDYLQQQFNLVSRKIPPECENIQHWQNLLHKHQRLDTVFESLVMPMVCTYNSELFVNHTDNTVNYFKDFEEECIALFEQFKKGKKEPKVEFILLLLPIPCKDTLNTALNERLVHMQKM